MMITDTPRFTLTDLYAAQETCSHEWTSVSSDSVDRGSVYCRICDKDK